jgi:WD40 repeat protein
VYDSETFEVLTEKAGLHSMGINDFCFADDGQIVTCSSDRTIKQWKINNPTLDEERTLNLSEFDTTGLTDNVEKQQLGLLLDA